jgi:branched-chain amino acid transport system substrate-binding protein
MASAYSFCRHLLQSVVLSVALLTAAGTSTAQNTVLVGAPLPLTGGLAPEGLKLQRGYDLWAEEVNKAGGVTVGKSKMPVKIVYYDYQSNTPRAVQLAEKLITDDKVHFMFSPFGSGATKAASAVSERYGVPTIAPTASSVEVYDQGYKNLFGTYTPNNTLTEPIADMVRKNAPQVRRVAILARNDLYPLALAEEFDRSAKARGFTVAYFEKYAIGTLDHASAITQIRAAKPDWIIVTGYINDMVLVRKQMSDQNLRAPVVTMINGPAYQEFMDAAGPLANNVTSASWWHPAARYASKDVFKSSENFTKLFRAKYKIEPDFTSAGGAVAGVVLQMAIEAAGTLDRDKVRAALGSGKFPTFFGPIAFGPQGYANSYTPPVFQIQGGKPTVLFPTEIKMADFRLGVS